MDDSKKEAAPEIETQKQPIKTECPYCHEIFKISKLCPSCGWGCDKEAKYCGHCGKRL